MGHGAVKTASAITNSYSTEPRGLFVGTPLCVVEPKTSAEICAILALCSKYLVEVVPQGGNTGLVGGQTPNNTGQQIILSLRRLTQVREIDPISNTMTLEAGVTLHEAQEFAHSVERYFPLSMASEGSCTIGGNLATNAGGVHVLAYGPARDLTLGVEVALADGRLLTTLSKLRKDNTGYDLTRLFIGSEGTLGVITAATLKLFPQPRTQEIAFLGLESPTQALHLLNFIKAGAGSTLQAFELIPSIALKLVLTHIPNTREPLAESHPWYALIEIASNAENEPHSLLTHLLSSAITQRFAQDAIIATSLAQARALWSLRENISEAQKREGGSIKHDISVPIDCIPAFIDQAGQLIQENFPQARPVPFGHMGDGNLHYNISQPVGADKAQFLSQWAQMSQIIHKLTQDFGGSISAEHGIGQLKRHLLTQVKDPVALDIMRNLKTMLDPLGILNPGKVI